MRKRVVRTERQPKKKKRKKKKKFLPGPPIQYHHDQYEPESGEQVGATAGHLFKGEHSIQTSLRRQTKNVSKWFIECLKIWLEKAEALNANGIRQYRDLDREIEMLPEGQSFHCPFCGMGFLVHKNRERHKLICHKRGDHL